MLAQKRIYDLGTRPRDEHKSGVHAPRYANAGKDCESAKQGTILIFNDIKEDFMQKGKIIKGIGGFYYVHTVTM